MRSFTLALALTTALLAGCSPQEGRTADTKQSQPQSTAATTPPAAPAQKATGKIEISPAKPKQGDEVTIALELNDSTGRAINDAEVEAAFIMPMGNSEMREQTDLKWRGRRYEGAITPSMAGAWNVQVRASKGGQLLLELPSKVDVK